MKPNKKCLNTLPGRLSAALLLAAGLVSGAVFAETSYEYAPVVESRPLYQVVEVSTPQEQCWEEEIAVDYSRQRQRSSTPVIVSTILGGAIGNAVGHNKSNKRVGAVLGAVLGHSIGRDIVRSNSRSGARGFEIVQRCETVYEQQQQERLIGYQVTYLYNGQERSIRTDTDPGDQIRLRVNVQPVL
jgi:uncharacterized protein YcfJ